MFCRIAFIVKNSLLSSLSNKITLLSNAPLLPQEFLTPHFLQKQNRKQYQETTIFLLKRDYWIMHFPEF